MATSKKPACKYGAKCYRRNADHLKNFSHPTPSKTRDHKDDKNHQPAKKKAKIDDFFTKKTGKKAEEEKEEEKATTSRPDLSDDSGDEEVEPHGDLDTAADEEEEKEEDKVDTPPPSPESAADNIEIKYGMKMPQDFFDFWDFCKSLNSAKPRDALKETLGLQLVGPFDVLAGRQHTGTARRGRKVNWHLHWRYYYDPPEFGAVLRSTDDSGFHFGYFRDDPAEMPVFVGSNNSLNCFIAKHGDNLFAAVADFADTEAKKKSGEAKNKIEKLRKQLASGATKHRYSLDAVTPAMKARDKKSVCKTFHKAGLMVPVDEHEVGYRPVPETPQNLRKILVAICDAKNEEERIRKMEPLEELVTLCQFANDECDYGESVELGLNLFSQGGEALHVVTSHLLPLGYTLLGRTVFSDIITAHLRNRSKSKRPDLLAS